MNGHAEQPEDDPQTGGQPQRHAGHDATPGDSGEPPKKRAHQSVSSPQIQSSLRKRNADQSRMLDGEKNTGENCDASVKKKARRQTVAKKQECAHRRNDWLNVQDHIDNGRIAVLERERKKNRTHGRTGEAGEDQVTPGTRINFSQIAELRNEDRQEHEQDEDVLPKHDHLRVEKIVERNPPRAFRSPQSGAETHEPRTVVCTARVAGLHANRLTVLPLRRQRIPSSSTGIPAAPKSEFRRAFVLHQDESSKLIVYLGAP